MKNPTSIHFRGENHTYNDQVSGEFLHSQNHVWIDGKQLELAKSLAIRNHSPDGFNWGYGGSGPAQTALAVCLELYGEAIARKVYQDFKWKFIGALPQGDRVETVIELPEEWRQRIAMLAAEPDYGVVQK